MGTTSERLPLNFCLAAFSRFFTYCEAALATAQKSDL
jgi:hypothetical protein